MGEGEDPALAQPWVILWEIAATRAELLLPHPQRCHTRERDTSPLVSDVLQALCVGNGPQQEGGAGPGRLPAPGNVLTALEAASTCAAISRPAGPKLSCAWALHQQHRRGSPFNLGAPGAMKGGSGALWAEQEGWTLPCGAGSSVPLSYHWLWSFPGS